MDRGAWMVATVHGVTKSQTRLSSTTIAPTAITWVIFTTPLQYSCLENPMDGGPGGLQTVQGVAKESDVT